MKQYSNENANKQTCKHAGLVSPPLTTKRASAPLLPMPLKHLASKTTIILSDVSPSSARDQSRHKDIVDGDCQSNALTVRFM